jgi:uncharacterized protein (TIGR02301 family)
MAPVSTVDMILRRTVAASMMLSAALIAIAPAHAQPKADAAAPATPPPEVERPAPYDDDLLRLAEVLGSVHYLRNLCNPGREEDWRAEMQQLLDSETKDEPKRKERLTAAFNRGYRSFASVYTGCTPQAIAAEERYRNEGATLATEITGRFGN